VSGALFEERMHSCVDCLVFLREGDLNGDVGVIPACARLRCRSALREALSRRNSISKEEQNWVGEEGVWLSIPSTNVLTLAGLVAEALGGPVPPTPPGSIGGEHDDGGWLNSLACELGGGGEAVEQGEAEVSPEVGGTGFFMRVYWEMCKGRTTAFVFQPTCMGHLKRSCPHLLLQESRPPCGKLHLRMRWLPVVPTPQDDAASPPLLDGQLQPQPADGGVPGSGRGRREGSEAGGSSPQASRASSSLDLRRGLGRLPPRSKQRQSLDGGGGEDVPGTTRLSSLLPSEHRPQEGVVAVRVAHTKLDYGTTLDQPVLAVSVISTTPGGATVKVGPLDAGAGVGVGGSRGAPAGVARQLCSPEAVERNGVLRWGRVFYCPVVVLPGVGPGALSTLRVCVELGSVASTAKYRMFGPELFCIDAQAAFHADVEVGGLDWYEPREGG
jgi:hypothetical protein